MMRMKLPLVMMLIIAMLTGCTAAAPPEKLTVTAALFPEYDWTRQILGDTSDIELRLLIGNGTDPHSYQPSAADMLVLKRSDLVIYSGGESEEWLRDALEDRENSILEMMDLPEVMLLEAAYSEGMQTRVEEDEADEHFWLSLKNAAVCCRAIADELCRLDPENAAAYRSNLERYLLQLSELDEAYREGVSSGRTGTILVADRFPFRYLTESYGLEAYAAFPGCSSESGASFATVLFLTQKLEELELRAILIPEGSDGRIAGTLARNASLPASAVLTLNSLQSVSRQQAEHTDYLTIMRQNLDILTTALE